MAVTRPALKSSSPSFALVFDKTYICIMYRIDVAECVLYHYIYYVILSKINRATMNLLLKVSRFFHNLQVKET